ncbi:MAG: hypothetical protein KA954_02790 [Chitinophagales bacterium]|nr:hypothetical protein [Bacteroidota bacterium]MBP7398485.1 hypothetical protein [Chitinophagales bacterium]MBK8683385.1 hypothetical protein [Bacteroidota bacterium]MBP8752878.1 hypothetical protein [Chitinophagales bacterium]MBP9189680.1 hypothetical protein [Chitinophagales bacterium]
MKIRVLLFYAIVGSVLFFSAGCNIFRGGEKCDCPKFGQTASIEINHAETNLSDWIPQENCLYSSNKQNVENLY